MHDSAYFSEAFLKSYDKCQGASCLNREKLKNV